MKPLSERIIDGLQSVQGSDDWKAFRRFKIGASRAPVICGVSPWQTPLQLYDEIVSGEEKAPNAAMQRGSALEEEARNALNCKTGLDFKPAVVMHPTLDWHYSSLDGLYVDGDNVLVCEIKCPGFEDHEQAILGRVPEKYIPQVLHILEDVPEADCLVYASYYKGNIVIVNVERGFAAMSTQLEKEKAFYESVCNLEEPEATDRDWISINDDESLSDQFKDASDAFDKAKEALESIRAEILKKAAQNSRCKIGLLKVQKVFRKGAVDYSKIEVLRGMNLEPYRKVGVLTWRVSL